MKSKPLNRFLELISVFFVVMSSTTVFFAIKNMMITMYLLFGSSVLLFFIQGKFTRRNIAVFSIITIIFILNYLINSEFAFFNNDYIIFIIRFISCFLIASSIEKNHFKKKYVFVMEIMAIVSIVCFLFTISFKGVSLPFQTTETIGNRTYTFTFYYVLGANGIQYRNCGMFWEPGGYQIYLCLSLLFVLKDKRAIWTKKRRYYLLVLFSLTILTTLSTTGMFCFALIIISQLFAKNESNKSKMPIFMAVVLGLVILAVFENATGVISNKLVSTNGSYSTRTLDLKVTTSLALTRPLFGYGYVNTYLPYYYEINGVVNNSNGFGSFVCSFGIPVAVAYLLYIFYRIKELYDLRWFEALLILVVFLLFFTSESVNIVTFFILLLYGFSDESKRLVQPHSILYRYESF